MAKIDFIHLGTIKPIETLNGWAVPREGEVVHIFGETYGVNSVSWKVEDGKLTAQVYMHKSYIPV